MVLLVLAAAGQNGVICTDRKQLSWLVMQFSRHERSGGA